MENAYFKNIIAVTNRHLCEGGMEEYLAQIERICLCHPKAVIFREKDMPEEAYGDILEKAKAICDRYHVACIAHTYWKTAEKLDIQAIHMPLLLLQNNPELRQKFKTVGVSAHSLNDVLLAEQLGATYVTAGHIFATSCKPNLPPRGTDFLREICGAASIPVYAIGGMQTNEDCLKQMQHLGAAGICVMSECMTWGIC